MTAPVVFDYAHPGDLIKPPHRYSCEECSATDTELLVISAWRKGDPASLFCADLFACYERMARDGVPL